MVERLQAVVAKIYLVVLSGSGVYLQTNRYETELIGGHRLRFGETVEQNVRRHIEGEQLGLLGVETRVSRGVTEQKLYILVKSDQPPAKGKKFETKSAREIMERHVVPVSRSVLWKHLNELELEA